MSDQDTDDQIHRQEVWSSNSNDCFHIKLVHEDGSVHAAFKPEFTYPIFGENEVIFGYKGLSIELTFAAHNLQPRLQIKYDEIYTEQSNTKPTDIRAELASFLHNEAFSDTALSFDDSATYKPPGERLRTYSNEEGQYEVYCCSLADDKAKGLLERMQVLVPLFIEGGSILQLEQDWTTQRWKLFTLWKVDDRGYALVGYATSYRIFVLKSEDTTLTVKSPLDFSSRERLSQFLILPTFQGGGHGQQLYRAMYAKLTKASNVHEFTVEDPNESFDELRDFCDLTYLRSQNAEFAALEICTDIPTESLGSAKTIPVDLIVPKQVRDKIRSDTKIDRRQFDRLVEIHTLSKIPLMHRSRSRITRGEKSTQKHDKQYYFWRMFVKQRLLIFNHDALIQLEHAERIEKLEGAVDSNQEYFNRLIEKVTSKEAAGILIESNKATTTNGGRHGKKRKVIEEDDNDSDVEIVSVSKKSKV